MGLISRVSSRTYREKVMNARLLNVGRRFQSMMDKAKKAFDEPIKGGANFRGGYKSHADRYGVRTYSLRELTETKSDYFRGLIWSSLAVFIIWDVFHDVSCHHKLYSDPANAKFHFFQDDKSVYGETEGALDTKMMKDAKIMNGGYLFYGQRSKSFQGRSQACKFVVSPRLLIIYQLKREFSFA